MIQIITDSSTLYTEEEARAIGIEAVPLCVSIGDYEGRDLKVDMEMYYNRIRSGQHPKSSQPPIGDVLEVFEKYPDSDIINISMADGLSGTYQSACSAKMMAENESRITVFNTKTLCGPHRYMVQMAQKMNERGCSKKEILDWLEEKANKTESFLIPQDFEFLKRGGRLTPVAAALGGVLKLKPVMKLTEDGTKLDKFSVKRTMSGAVKSVTDYLKEKDLGADHIAYVAHADAKKDAEFIKETLQNLFVDLEIKICELSPVFVAQGGPQCIAIQYIER